MKVFAYYTAFIALGFAAFALLSCSSKQPTPLYSSEEFHHSAVIWLQLVKYAQKHEGHFPEGNTSTEIFQKLINEKYAQPVLFWLPGRKTPTNIDRIDPENVGFDFTKGANLQSPNWVPLVIPTGFKIDYATNEATLLPSNNDMPYMTITVAYLNGVKITNIVQRPENLSPPMLNRILIMSPKPIDADTSRYKQLTPNGSL